MTDNYPTATRMTAVDAQFYWMSAKVPSDEFMLYAFDGEPTAFERAVDEIRSRAQACPALTLRVEDESPLTYPRWISTVIAHNQVLPHDLDDDSWGGCLDAVARLVDDQLDIRRESWRMHLFAPVHGIPGSAGPSTVAVMQFAHALCDGPRSLAMAAWLFGRATPVAEIAPSSGFLPWRGLVAAQAHRNQVRDTRAGLLPPAIAPQPALAPNARPRGAPSGRTLLRHRAQLKGPTATVAALPAVSGALSGHLRDAAPALVAEVTMAKPGVPHAHNHFANVTVGLYPELNQPARLQRIAADLT